MPTYFVESLAFTLSVEVHMVNNTAFVSLTGVCKPKKE